MHFRLHPENDDQETRAAPVSRDWPPNDGSGSADISAHGHYGDYRRLPLDGLRHGSGATLCSTQLLEHREAYGCRGHFRAWFLGVLCPEPLPSEMQDAPRYRSPAYIVRRRHRIRRLSNHMRCTRPTTCLGFTSYEVARNVLCGRCPVHRLARNSRYRNVCSPASYFDVGALGDDTPPPCRGFRQTPHL